MPTKICTKCKQEKSTDDFSYCHSALDKKDYYCKACKKIDYDRWYANLKFNPRKKQVLKPKRYCLTCGVQLSKKCKGDYCNYHRDRTGSNNSFYGKTHSKETIDKIKIVTAINSKKLWENEDYRNKVIKGVSKPRREGFKQEQSERTIQWYKDNPELLHIRSLKMKETWASGAMVSVPFRKAINKSTKEIKFYQFLKDSLPDSNVENDRVLHSMDNSWFFPDILIDDLLIVEFMGDYWHMNPEKYSATSYNAVSHKYAEDIWDADLWRKIKLRDLKYEVYYVWEGSVKGNEEQLLRDIKKTLYEVDWEFCS